MAFQREVAHRVFAAEFNASRATIESQGEKDPSYVISPLGAKMNRLHVVGVCTDVEQVGESGDLMRARISDPTGVFTVYAGQYQPDAALALSNLEPPCFVAVTGKARTYEPEPGSVFCSIRPESINLVDESTRDHWILDTVRRSTERLRASHLVQTDDDASVESLVKSGLGRAAAEGAVLAKERYGWTELPRFWETVRGAANHLVEGSDVPVHHVAPSDDGRPEAGAPAAPAWTPPAPTPADEVNDELDDAVLATVKKLEGDRGANWDDIVQEAGSDSVSSDDVDEALNRLMDKGLVYEPTLGILKTT